MPNPEYKAAERVFALLFLLSSNDGLSREEIFQRIDYKAVGTMSRMFERDVAFLKKQGFYVWSKRVRRGPALYGIIQPEDVFKRSGGA